MRACYDRLFLNTTKKGHKSAMAQTSRTSDRAELTTAYRTMITLADEYNAVMDCDEADGKTLKHLKQSTKRAKNAVQTVRDILPRTEH